MGLTSVLSVVAAGIIRTILLNNVINQTYDVSWASYTMWIWTIVELYTSIIAASAPALKPFFKRCSVDANPKGYGDDTYGAELDQRHNGGTKKVTVVTTSSRAHVLNKHIDVDQIGVAIGGGGGHHERKDSRGSNLESLQDRVDVLMKHIRTRRSLDASSEFAKSSVGDGVDESQPSKVNDIASTVPHQTEIRAAPQHDKRGFVELRSFEQDRTSAVHFSRPTSRSRLSSPAVHGLVTHGDPRPRHSVSPESLRGDRATSRSSVSSNSNESVETLRLRLQGGSESDHNKLGVSQLGLAL